MTRVVILQEYIPTYRVPFFEALHKSAALEGIDLVVACGTPNQAQGLRGDSASVAFEIRIPQREWSIFGRRVVRREVSDVVARADMVILEQARRNLDAYGLLAPRRGAPPLVALWGHGKDYTRKTKSLDRVMQRWLTLRADWFFAYTSGGVDAVTEAGFPRQRTTLVQNSIDTTALRESVVAISREAIAEFGSEYDLHGKTALYMGALDESKRLPFLLESAQRIHEMDSDFRLLIGGDGAQRDDVENSAAQCSWLTYLGPIGGRQKALALASAQALTMPGRVGLVAVDSFAAGIPIVTTSWPWHAPEFEYLEHRRNAVVTEDSVACFAVEVVALLNDDDRLESLRAECISAAEVYTVRAMAQNFLIGLRQALQV